MIGAITTILGQLPVNMMMNMKNLETENGTEESVMNKKIFKDLYGNTASIQWCQGHYLLTCRNTNGKVWKKSEYATEKGARIALGKTGEGWREI